MILSIIMLGDPLLRKKAEEITIFDDELKVLVLNMIETMDAMNGIGLAAPQVGISKRLFVLRNYLETDSDEVELSDPVVYINPKIVNRSKELLYDEEGCLSIPGVRGSVYRPSWIEIEAVNEKNEPFRQKVEGFNARVRLHEYDHLDGVLFIDMLSFDQKKKIKHKLQEIEKKTKAILR